MLPDLWSLYALMLKSRLFEEIIAKLWHEGLISGEMHLGTGEEGIIAGVTAHLQDGDALALDHRGTAALLMRGEDPVLILRELLGYADGLCGGMGGHMHLFSKKLLAVSSGIVGAGGPAAAGFALAAQYLRPGTVSAAFLGEGAVNQGMLMESMNLAAVWKLPVLFVCKDDDWSITTPSKEMTAGSLKERMKGLGLPYTEVDGRDVTEVWMAVQMLLKGLRAGEGPAFLHARCVHLEGHFLGFQLLRMIRSPLREMPGISRSLTKSILKPKGSSIKKRIKGLKAITSSVLSAMRDPRRDQANDPVMRTRKELPPDEKRILELEKKIQNEIKNILQSALQEEPE